MWQSKCHDAVRVRGGKVGISGAIARRKPKSMVMTLISHTGRKCLPLPPYLVIRCASGRCVKEGWWVSGKLGSLENGGLVK